MKEQQARRKEIRAEQEVSHHLSFFGLYLCQFQVRLAKQKKEEEAKEEVVAVVEDRGQDGKEEEEDIILREQVNSLKLQVKQGKPIRLFDQ